VVQNTSVVGKIHLSHLSLAAENIPQQLFQESSSRNAKSGTQ